MIKKTLLISSLILCCSVYAKGPIPSPDGKCSASDEGKYATVIMPIKMTNNAATDVKVYLWGDNSHNSWPACSPSSFMANYNSVTSLTITCEVQCYYEDWGILAAGLSENARKHYIKSQLSVIDSNPQTAIIAKDGKSF